MPFTAQELAHAANAVIDFHIRGKFESQTIQDKPLLNALMGKQKTFPAAKENITGGVKGVYTTQIQGISGDDTAIYRNPANGKRWQYPWKEIHAGIMVTMTELKKAGISVVDTNGAKTTTSSDAEKAVLADLLEDKVEDMKEGWDRGMNLMFWRDGTQDSKLVAGVRSAILDVPSTGITGGLDRGANSWWRNRASLLIASNSGTWANQPLVRVLQQEFRQLRRYGGKPDKFLCGSDFMDAFEMELRAKGNYTLEGWAKAPNGAKAIDASVADLMFKGVTLEYDPTLDDESLSKYGYVLDSSQIRPYVMEGEDRKTHNPARPADKYVIYRAMTWTGGLVFRRLNSSGVYSIA